MTDSLHMYMSYQYYYVILPSVEWVFGCTFHNYYDCRVVGTSVEDADAVLMERNVTHFAATATSR